MQKLNFDIPFSSFASTTFINCFASVYLYLEGILQEGNDVTFCNQWENGECNGCGNCESKPQALQEKFFSYLTLCVDTVPFVANLMGHQLIWRRR